MSVWKSLQAHIMSTTDLAEAWNTLQKQLEFISITQIVHLNRKFYAASMKEGDNLTLSGPAFSVVRQAGGGGGGSEAQMPKMKVNINQLK